LTNGIVLRQNVEQANILALRDAYGKLQAFSATDNRGWIYWAGIHGFPQFFCWHHGRVGGGPVALPYNLFLPWHRAYLLYWEHIARDQNEDAIPPWWDWTSALSHEIGVPVAYAQQEVDGQPNPLFSGPKPATPDDPAGPTQRFPGDPEVLRRITQPIDDILELNSFVDFSEQLENVHDGIHGWTGGGGDMSFVALSAFDPIFWAHHCMIDRLWYLWQLRHGVFNIPPDYLPRPLEPFGLTVRDVLDIHSLGYEYATSSATLAAA
jgi:tyrosinase